MDMATAFQLVKKNCWKASCIALGKISKGAYVILDASGVLCVFDGAHTVPVQTSMKVCPDVWDKAKNEEWGICL